MMVDHGIGIRMILSECSKEIVESITTELNNKLKSIDANVHLYVSYLGKYWKNPGEYEMTITIDPSKIKTFQYLTEIFSMNWYQYSYSSVWSNNMQEYEYFLHSVVNWVEVFDWGATETGDADAKQVIFKRDEGGFYGCNWVRSPRLALFVSFFFHDITQDRDEQVVEKIKNTQYEEFVRCSLKRVGDNFYLNYPFTPIEDIIIPVDELIRLVKQWQDLTEQKISPIIVSEEDGKWKISPELGQGA